MTKCENCRWDIPDGASSCPYCGHRFRLDTDEEERRRRMLRGHLLNVMRQKKRYPGALSVVSTLMNIVARASIAISVTAMSVVVLAASVMIVTKGAGTTAPPLTSYMATQTTLGNNTSTPLSAPCSNSPIRPTPGAGTGNNLTFSGAVVGTMCVVNNDGCSGPGDYNYAAGIKGTINGKLYIFGFVTAVYKGPGNYSRTAVVVLRVGDNGPDQSWDSGFSGNKTVNSDEISGTVDALMYAFHNTSGTVHVIGTWRCSKLQRS